jgi:hypothetical protein
MTHGIERVKIPNFTDLLTVWVTHHFIYPDHRLRREDEYSVRTSGFSRKGGFAF